MTSELFVGTLVRGVSYVVRNRKDGDDLIFENGKGLVIDELMQAYLADVTDEVVGPADPDTGAFEIISKPKFQFEIYEGAAPIGAVAHPVAPPPRRIRREA